jgi:hypothetical protein
MIAKIDPQNFKDIGRIFRGIEYPAFIAWEEPRSANRTQVAIINVGKDGCIAAYFQDSTGLIWETEQSDKTVPSDGWSKRALFRARKKSPLAVINNPYEGANGSLNNVWMTALGPRYVLIKEQSLINLLAVFTHLLCRRY